MDRRRAQRNQTGSFAKLGLSSSMLEALAHAAYEEPTPIQAGFIPRALAGVDVVGQARTGTGKTAAFVISILERLPKDQHGHTPRALVLVPTRELAVQVCGELEKLSHGGRVRSVPLYGGKPIRGQIESLRRGVDIVVGTPGRVLDHMGRHTLDLTHLMCVVLDEADRMLDIGFRPDIERILRGCPRERQTLLLSATVPPPIQRLAQRYMQSPEMLDLSDKDVTVETIDQYYFTVEDRHKFELLVRLLQREKPAQAIVFCRTKRGTDALYQKLSKKFDGVDAIHGDMEQRDRDRVMKRFRAGEVKCLVATDVVGRGIDVTGISHIINFDVPQFCDDYVHRVGRTGRMGRDGVAFTFVGPYEGHELTKIEQRINRLLVRDEMKDFEARPRPATGPTVPEVEAPAPPPPPVAAMRRPPKRYRRGL